MKPLRKYLKLSSVFIFALLLSLGCSKDELSDIEKKIIGTWHCDRKVYVITKDKAFSLLIL